LAFLNPRAVKPVNANRRNAIIVRFSLVYLMLVLLMCFLLYFSFIVVPKKQSELTAITNEQVDDLIRHTNDADTLVIQIQKASDVDAKALVPLFKWTGDLQKAFKQPFYTSIITSYVDLFNDIVKTKGNDTTLASLKTKMTALQKENLSLMQLNEDLNEQLVLAKAK
jgi:hypothetical protein